MSYFTQDWWGKVRKMPKNVELRFILMAQKDFSKFYIKATNQLYSKWTVDFLPLEKTKPYLICRVLVCFCVWVRTCLCECVPVGALRYPMLISTTAECSLKGFLLRRFHIPRRSTEPSSVPGMPGPKKLKRPNLATSSF